jgi:hypothetical protein
VLLANVGSLQRIVAPINLTLIPVQQSPGVQRSLRKQPVEARFEIQTYVARTTPTPAKPAAPGTGE